VTGELVATRVYHDIPASGEGTLHTHYAETTFGYDAHGRRDREVAPDGTITRSVFDAPGRLASQWVGTSPLSGGSKKVDEMPQPSNRVGQSLAFECGQQLFGSPRRVVETGPLPFDSGADYAGSHIEQADQKVIRVQCLHVEAGQCLRREVLQVVGHDEFGAGAYRGSHNVSVVEIRQRQRVDQVFVARYQAITDSLIH
jgi:YD repeat-containing protein